MTEKRAKFQFATEMAQKAVTYIFTFPLDDLIFKTISLTKKNYI